MTTGFAASKLLINFSACSFLRSWACIKIASRWKPARPGSSWAVARVYALRDFFTGDVLNLHFWLRILSGMEGDGDLMKMLMHADPPDENIQGPMDDTAMVQTGV